MSARPTPHTEDCDRAGLGGARPGNLSRVEEAVRLRPIYHLALANEWSEAVESGEYRQSTLRKSLDDEGFIHCSFGEQLQRIADFLYRGRLDVVLLHIEPSALHAEIRVENLEGGEDLFPHIYGPLPVTAVTRVDAVDVASDGRLEVSHFVTR